MNVSINRAAARRFVAAFLMVFLALVLLDKSAAIADPVSPQDSPQAVDTQPADSG